MGGQLIEGMVVDTHVQSAVFLLSEQDRSVIWTGGRLNVAQA